MSIPVLAHYATEIEAEAKRVCGKDWVDWMFRRSRHLADLTPIELAATPAGARVVLFELRRLSP